MTMLSAAKTNATRTCLLIVKPSIFCNLPFGMVYRPVVCKHLPFRPESTAQVC